MRKLIKLILAGLVIVAGSVLLTQRANHGETVGVDSTEQITQNQIQETAAPETEAADQTAPQTYIVCLDAGHGGGYGAISKIDGRYESDDTLRLTLAVRDVLESYTDVTVIMTRTEDVDVDNAVRAQIAIDNGADVFVSIHRNSDSSGIHSGIEGWIHSSNPEISREMGEQLLTAIADVGVTKNLGIKTGTWDEPDVNYKAVRLTHEAGMPSVLLEIGFLSNARDNELFDQNLDAYAKALAEALYDWLVERMPR